MMTNRDSFQLHESLLPVDLSSRAASSIVDMVVQARENAIVEAIRENDFEKYRVLRIIERHPTGANTTIAGPGDFGAILPKIETERYRRSAPPQDAYSGPCTVMTVTRPLLERQLPKLDRDVVIEKGLGRFLPDYDVANEYCDDGVHHQSTFEGDDCPFCEITHRRDREHEKREQ